MYFPRLLQVGGPLQNCIFRYGQHLSKEEVEALVAPHPETVDLVDSWLTAHDIDLSSAQRENGGSWLTVVVSVDQASRMLNTTYNVYHHAQSNDYVVRAMSYSLPSVLLEHIGTVNPTTYFGTMRRMKATSFLQPDRETISKEDAIAQLSAISPGNLATVPSSCSRTITPACLRALYNTVNYTPTQTDVNKLGVAGYLEEFANDADLQVSILALQLIDLSFFSGS